jgi:hypothetical protein
MSLFQLVLVGYNFREVAALVPETDLVDFLQKVDLSGDRRLSLLWKSDRRETDLLLDRQM